MRTIKFRGRCSLESKYAGEWVIGGYVPPRDGDEYEDEDGLIIANLGDDCSCTYHVNPKTVGQYTGMKDKDGLEIYEGDIVVAMSLRTESFGKKKTGVIIYDEELACYDIECDDRQRTLASSIPDIELGVIGNIYDNPELLEGGKNEMP